MSTRPRQTPTSRAWFVAATSALLVLACSSSQPSAQSNDGGPPDATTDATNPQGDGDASDDNGDASDDGGSNLCAEAGTCVSGCHAGLVSCDGTCGALSMDVPDGTSCGANGVCEGGQCVACAPDAPCSPLAAPCHTGALTCSASGSTCVDQGLKAPKGTACGAPTAKTFCDPSGACACKAGGVCPLAANPCHIGILSCSTVTSPGVATCTDSGSSLLPGASCGTNVACSFGVCTPITCATTTADGGVATCTPANACDQGTVSCPAGEFSVQVCTDTGVPLGAGAACEGGTCDGDGGCGL